MIAHAGRVSVAASGLALAATMIGCGDNVTGPHVWRSVVTQSSAKQVTVSTDTVVVYQTLTGSLVDSGNHAVPGTLFRESCNRRYDNGVLTQDWNCLAVLNTGPRVYVAGGHASGLIGDLPTLADPRLGGKLRIVVETPPAPASSVYVVKIVAVPGGQG